MRKPPSGTAAPPSRGGPWHSPTSAACTTYGDGVPQDHAEAARWFRGAAEQGYAEAQLNLGLMHYHGEGVPQDYAEAALWYRRAAEQGRAVAQSNLGSMHYHGEGVPQDYAEAARWLTKAAEQGPGTGRARRHVLPRQGRAAGLCTRLCLVEPC